MKATISLNILKTASDCYLEKTFSSYVDNTFFNELKTRRIISRIRPSSSKTVIVTGPGTLLHLK